MRSLVQLLAVIAAFSTAAAVRAQEEWPRFHVGVAAGPEPRLSPDLGSAPVPEPLLVKTSLDSDDTGWKVVAGFRPVRVVGAEVQYIDFGEGVTAVRAGGSGQVPRQSLSMQVRANATVLTALFFIPEPLPWIDVYAKVGVAKLDEWLSVRGYDLLGCLPLTDCTYYIDVDQTDSHPYAGIGARFKEVGRAWGVRVEYEEIDGDFGGNTKMWSLGIAWER